MRSRFFADQSKSFGNTTLLMSLGRPSGVGKPATLTAAKNCEAIFSDSSVMAQSRNCFAAGFFAPFRVSPLASISYPEPSGASPIATGEPFLIISWATYSNETPMARSPAAESLQGLEPDFVYSAMFLSSASMYFQPAASPLRCRMDSTERYPVPEEAGFGITTWPL